ncbi:flagellar biosynthetic protein FliR [bacterium]|nr:flagellar biosynthetic protein FliR [bacterium]
MEAIVKQLVILFPQVNAAFSVAILIFARMLGFIIQAPVFSRKEAPSMVRVCFALILTITLSSVIIPTIQAPAKYDLVLLIILNLIVGTFIGFLAKVILIAVEAGADMINMQMGLSSAMVLDPASNKQVSLIEKIFSTLGVLIFINVGGIYWLIHAFIRSFDIFPVFAVSIPLEQIVNLNYVIKMTSNVLFMGLQIASPILLATLGQDIILGTISKTAPQINVFQLSFLFKPVFGAAILTWIMPMMINVISDYFMTYSNIF